MPSGGDRRTGGKEGASRYDARNIFGFIDPLTPCPHLNLIYTTKYTQPPLLCPLFEDPLPLSDADIISGSSLEWSAEEEVQMEFNLSVGVGSAR